MNDLQNNQQDDIHLLCIHHMLHMSSNIKYIFFYKYLREWLYFILFDFIKGEKNCEEFFRKSEKFSKFYYHQQDLKISSQAIKYMVKISHLYLVKKNIL